MNYTHPSICPIESSIVVKVTFNGHIRKVLSQPLNLSELTAVVKRLYSIDINANDNESYGLKYRDSDGDWISIFDDSDLEVAFALLGKNETFRVLVSELPSPEFPEMALKDMSHSGNSVPNTANHMVHVGELNADGYPLFPNTNSQMQRTCEIEQFNGPILSSVDAVASDKTRNHMDNCFVSDPVKLGTLDVLSNRLVDTNLRDDSFSGYPKVEKVNQAPPTSLTESAMDLKSSLFQNLFSQSQLQTSPGNFEMSYSASLSGLAPPVPLQPQASGIAQQEMQEQLQYLKNDIFGSPTTPRSLPGYPTSISEYPSTIAGGPPQVYSREAFVSPSGQVTSYEQASFPLPVSSFHPPPSAQVYPSMGNQQPAQQAPYMPSYQNQGIIPPPMTSGFIQHQPGATRPSSAFQGFMARPTRPSNPQHHM